MSDYWIRGTISKASRNELLEDSSQVIFLSSVASLLLLLIAMPSK